MRVVILGDRNGTGAVLARQCRGAGEDQGGAFDGQAASSPLSEVVFLDPRDLDPADTRSCGDRLRELAPDVVVYAPWLDNADEAERAPNTCRTVHIRAAGNLVDACRSMGCRYVQWSSSIVFGGDACPEPHSESERPAPWGVLAEALVEAERIAASWERSLIVRTGALFGQDPRRPDCFVNSVVRLARRTRRLLVVDTFRHNPTAVEDAARAVWYLLRQCRTGLYHVANPGVATRLELAREVVAILGLSTEVAPIDPDEFGKPSALPARAILDTRCYDSLPGAPQLPPWREALRGYLTMALADAKRWPS